MIHLIVRLPVPYQRTLCRTLHDSYNGAVIAWFLERANESYPCEADREDCFRREYLSEVGFGKLFRALWADREAVVLLGGWSSPMTARTLLFTTLLRIPVFIWADHPHPRQRSRSANALRKVYLRMLSIITRGYLACGRPTVQHLESLGIRPQRITNFPYWVAVPEEWSVSAGCKNNVNAPLRLLAVGRLVPVKQFEVAIQALAQVNREGDLQAELVIAGDGPERTKLEAVAASLGCKEAVRFYGWLSNADVFEELERTDAMVLTSKFDAYGVVVLEAMARARTVLASDSVIGARDRNEAGALFLHSSGDAEMLAGQIRALARDRELLRRSSLAARSVAEKWPPERAAAILTTLLRENRLNAGVVKTRTLARSESQNANVT